LNVPGAKTIKIAEVDNNGALYNNAAVFATIQPGAYLNITEMGSVNTSYGIYLITGPPVDSGIYWSFPVISVSQHEFWALSTATNISVQFSPSASGGSGGVNPAPSISGTNGFRLTLTSLTPVDPVDRVAKSTIYWTPYDSDSIALYDGVVWNIRQVSERSFALSGLVANANYDMFVFDNAGVPTLERGPVWTNDTTRSVGLVRQNGVWTKVGFPTRRYVGSFRTTSTTTTESSGQFRYLFNVDNPVAARSYKVSAFTHSWNSTTLRIWGANDSYGSVFALIGVSGERPLDGSVMTYGTAGAGGDARISCSVSTNPATLNNDMPANLQQQQGAMGIAAPKVILQQGLNYIRPVQQSFGGSNTYYYLFTDFSIDL